MINAGLKLGLVVGDVGEGDVRANRYVEMGVNRRCEKRQVRKRVV